MRPSNLVGAELLVGEPEPGTLRPAVSPARSIVSAAGDALWDSVVEWTEATLKTAEQVGQRTCLPMWSSRTRIRAEQCGQSVRRVTAAIVRSYRTVNLTKHSRMWAAEE